MTDLDHACDGCAVTVHADGTHIHAAGCPNAPTAEPDGTGQPGWCPRCRRHAALITDNEGRLAVAIDHPNNCPSAT